MRKIFFSILLVVVLASACTSGESSSGTAVEPETVSTSNNASVEVVATGILPTIPPPTSTPAPTITPLPMPTEAPIEPSGASLPADEIVLSFSREGGKQGLVELYEVLGDGSISLNGAPAGSADTIALLDLLTAIQDNGYGTLENSYMPKDTCCDRFSYIVQVYTGSGLHEVNALDGEPATPDSFWQAVELIQQFLFDNTQS